MIDDTTATVDDTALRDRLVEAFNSTHMPSPPELEASYRHDGHDFNSACYVCRGDVEKLVDAVLSVLAAWTRAARGGRHD